MQQNLPKYFNKKSGESNMININKDIEIDFSNIIAPKSEKLRKFKLIGRVENGKFVKILSKGDFGSNNYLDISMNEDKITKKYLEIYSDLTNPLLTEYNFLKDLQAGNYYFLLLLIKRIQSRNLK